MKKSLLFLIFCSFVFFACASKQPSESTQKEEISEPLIEEELSNSESENIIIESESQENKSSETVDNKENLENNSENSTVFEDEILLPAVLSEEELAFYHKELKEIEEPEIITLEPPEDDYEDDIDILIPPITEPSVEEFIDESEITLSDEDEINIEEKNSTDEIIDNQEEDEFDSSETVIEEEDKLKQQTKTKKIINDNNDEVIALDKTSSMQETEEVFEEEQPEIPEEIIPSRSVTMKKSEYLDITYPGNGWVFMGLTDNSKDIVYFGRKVGTENTNFSVVARNAGTKYLHFYKNDPVTGTYIDDYLEVIVLDEKGSNKTHVSAPEYKTPVKKVEKKQKKVEATSEKQNTVQEEKDISSTMENTKPVQSVNNQTKSTTTSPSKAVSNQSVEEKNISTETTETIDPAKLLSEGKSLFEAKSYRQAYDKISKFLECGTKNIDEGLYIKAQILEAKSELQNINEALEVYTTLTKNYPSSKYWDNANKRIIYLKRFYLEGR